GSRSLMESLAVGTTPACIDVVGSSSEILEDGKYGIIVKEFDDDKFAQAIYKEYVTPTFEKAKILERSKEFLMEQNTQKYLSFFESTLKSADKK
ncbi:MAG: glycosyltransferase, partial [Clostridia bacterium]|nr:glycosyltransferase [Clostridia bacterium]